MMLNHLLKGCELTGTTLPEELEITSISCDSRQVGPGCLFIAVEGTAADGHNFIGQAIENGAAAVLAQRMPQHILSGTQDRIILATDTRKITAQAAANFYGHPCRDLVMVGITGTNGKTTTSWILESILVAAGYTPGVIGTVNIRYPGKTMENPITTPDAISLQKTLADMKQAGVTHVVMEVSSHSLDQKRVTGCLFDAAVFTNLTRDHLDYHNTFDTYFDCKKKLFTDHLKSRNATAVINVDTDYGRRLASQINGSMLRTSTASGNAGPEEIKAYNIEDTISGLSADVAFNGTVRPMTSVLTGRFNLENILSAAGAALAIGISSDTIINGIKTLSRVPGRLEKLETDLNRHIFVDYAHTPDALASILDTLSQRAPAKLITVFGCGGDRDRTKRGPMGKIACKYSDIAIVTSDNPRTESPDAIVEDILQGIKEDQVPELDPEKPAPGIQGYIQEVDRAKALAMAVEISAPQDIIVAAGKGHETYQITNTGIIHFDDMEHLATACEKLATPYDWTVSDLEAALNTAPAMPVQSSSQRFKTIGTDSRTIETDMVFLALEGETFDGHDFVPALARKGVKAFIVRTGFLASLETQIRQQLTKRSLLVFEVENTLTALGSLARFSRDRADVKLVAITGSNGKTTTRKMTREIFSKQYDVLATQGNFNNEIGMPSTLLKLAPVHECAVIEMGMNHPGEISRLSAIARPDIAVITNTSGAHLEGLKTADNVARAKSEIFESVRPDGTALVFSDDPRRDIMASHARGNPNIARLVYFGQGKDADIRAKRIGTDDSGLNFLADCDGQTVEIRIHSPARFMVNNALAAMGAALTADIELEHIRDGLAAFRPVKGRMNIGRLSCGTHLIDDTYNANPASMAQALKTLDQVAGKGNGLAALGDMLELGPDSDALHREIGALAARLAPARLCLFGTQAAHIKSSALENGFPEDKIFLGTKKEIAKVLAPELDKDKWLLLKGSRGMAMETLIPEIETLIKAERKAD